MAAICLVLFPLRILSYGYMPTDDALRHAAKAISGKSWPEILLLRPEITVDHNPGWHWTLSVLHQAAGWDGWMLVAFSVVVLFVAAAGAPLPWLKRPEAWVATLALILVVFPYFADRALLGRPLLFTVGVSLTLVSLWTREGEPWISRGKVASSIGLIAASAWVHGSWYLLALLPAAFFLARLWKKAWVLTFCWVSGSVVGALLTGQPWSFLSQTVLIPVLALQLDVPEHALVREFQPFTATYGAVLVVGVLLAARKLAGLSLTGWARDPVLWLALLGWLGGFRVVRFWLDWGIPALALWVAHQGEDLLEKYVPVQSSTRLFVGALAGAILFFGPGSDRHARWSQWGTLDCLDTRRPEHAGWVPDRGGILYSVDLTVFYQTFFRNPHGPWRYVLGFEPAFMPAEDLAVYQELCRTLNAVRACAPWVKKMTAADRLVLQAGPATRPAIRELEWHYAATNTWVGRLPARPLLPL